MASLLHGRNLARICALEPGDCAAKGRLLLASPLPTPFQKKPFTDKRLCANSWTKQRKEKGRN
jgi:hypothetical protein